MRPDRRALRSPWLAFGWLLGMVVLITGLATVLFAEDDWQSALFGGVLLVLPGAWVVARIPFMRVTLARDRLTNHGVFRNRSIPWGDVTGVGIAEVDDKGIALVFAPVVLLNGTDDWGLMQLAGYTTPSRALRSRMGRQARLIAEHGNVAFLGLADGV